MNEQIVFRQYREEDRPALETMVRETWEYDRFCTPKIAAKMARVFLNSCLINQTFTRVALVDQMPVGVIMGKNIQRHRCPLWLRAKWLQSLASLYRAKEGREACGIFGSVQDIDQELLSACGKRYPGELAFFAIRKTCRGKGIGRQLFQKVVEEMRSQDISEFYLFTDTSCNYPFYEHLGMTRRGEKTQEIDVKGEKEEMTFFIYDYQIK